jgi:hypothetical protein
MLVMARSYPQLFRVELLRKASAWLSQISTPYGVQASYRVAPQAKRKAATPTDKPRFFRSVVAVNVSSITRGL